MIKLKVFIKLLSTILLLCLVFSILPAANVHADNGGPQFQIDVWTEKGGQGINAHGGTFYVGEEVVLFIGTTMDCKATLMVYGKSTIDPLGGIRDLDAGSMYRIPLGIAEAMDIGTWGATFQAAAFNQGQQIDSVTFDIVRPPPGTVPGTVPQPSPQPSSPETPAGGDKPANTLNPGDASELAALTALMMAQGKLPPDPKMDVDQDGQVTEKDAGLILKWTIKGQQSGPSQPDQQDESSAKPELQVTPPDKDDDLAIVPDQQDESSAKPGLQVAPPDKDDNPAIVPDSATADTQALEGKWEMTRQSIQPPMPSMMPDFAVNLIIPSKSTWAIKRVGDDLTIKYDGRSTWYRKLLLGSGINEGSTTAVVGNQGKSCTFKTPVKFYWASLPFPLSLVAGDIKEIKGSFTNTVNLSVTGNSMSATVTIDNVQGSFIEQDKSGKSVNKQIHYNSKIVYKGTSK